jgi:hypothetical protein
VNVPDDVFTFHGGNLLHRPVIGKLIRELFEPFRAGLTNQPLATAGLSRQSETAADKPETRNYKAVFFPGANPVQKWFVKIRGIRVKLQG